jgi:peptide/nickel transport system ATP-binding protein
MITFDQLSIGFPSGKGYVEVVKNLSFTLQRAKVLAIVGESGSGKSVSALSTFGLIPSAHILSGELQLQLQDQLIDLKQCDSAQLRQLLREHTGFIFQEPLSALNPLMSCGKQVLERLNGSKKQKDKVLEMFRKVRLPDPERVYDAYPHEISGGQRQRVMIAMALIHEPDLIIADEPTTALDASVQLEIVELLTSLVKEQNSSMIFISHDLALVKKIADDVLVMYRGVQIEHRSVRDLFTKSEHPYTKALLSVKPSAEKKGHFLPVLKKFDPLDQPTDELFTNAGEWPLVENRLKTPILRVRKLNVSYPPYKSKVLDNIELDLFKGEALGILGESGSGKSTLARAVAKLQPYEGTIHFEDEDIHSIQRKFPALVQLIFQDPFSALNPRMKCGKAIEEVVGLHQKKANKKQKVAELLEEVGLSASDADKYPHEFSGGQRQRICIARALAATPKLLICDESVSALDVSVQAQILNLLKNLQLQKELSILFISHDIAVVGWFCDRIAILDKGKIVEINDSKSLLNAPQHPYTQALLSNSLSV